MLKAGIIGYGTLGKSISELILGKQAGDINLKNILVFYFTTMPEKLVKYKIEETGADGYILKPFSLSELSELLESIV